MRNSNIIALAALMMLAVSCKKNIVEKTDNGNTNPNPTVAIEQSPDITRIIKFNKDVTARRENPELKTREVITLDEAKNNIADLFNAVYGEPTEYYGETEHAEFTITLAVDDDGNVLLDDAVAAYEEAVEMARENYHASTLENKGYICMSATVGQQRGGTAEVRLNGVYGKKTEEPTITDEYFEETRSWPYMYNAWGYPMPTEEKGADDTLECVMKACLHINHEIIPTNRREVLISSVFCEFTPNEYPEWGLFYRYDVNNISISGRDMNRFLENGIEVATVILPSINHISLSGGGSGQNAYEFQYKISTLIIDGGTYYDDQNNCFIGHKYKINYGIPCYIENGQIVQEDL